MPCMLLQTLHFAGLVNSYVLENVVNLRDLGGECLLRGLASALSYIHTDAAVKLVEPEDSTGVWVVSVTFESKPGVQRLLARARASTMLVMDKLPYLVERNVTICDRVKFDLEFHHREVELSTTGARDTGLNLAEQPGSWSLLLAAQKAADETRRNEQALATAAKDYKPDYIGQAGMHIVNNKSNHVDYVSLEFVLQHFKGKEPPKHLESWMSDEHLEVAAALLGHSQRTKRLSRSCMKSLATDLERFVQGHSDDSKLIELKDQFMGRDKKIAHLWEFVSGAGLAEESIDARGDCWALMMMAGHEISFQEALNPGVFTRNLVCEHVKVVSSCHCVRVNKRVCENDR